VRVLLVTQYFWPESFYINSVACALVERGIVVDVLTAKPNYPEGKIFPGYRHWGIQVERYLGALVLRLPIFMRGTRSGWRLVLNYLSFVLSGMVLAPWLLQGRRYDAIFVYAPSPILQAIPALFLGWLKKARVIIWVQDLWPESLEATGHIQSRLLLGGVTKVVRVIYRRADLLLGGVDIS
jgi:hypothetical protein